MKLRRHNLFLITLLVAFFASVIDVQAGDPAADSPIGKLLPFAVGFILLVFVSMSLPYWIVAFVAAGIFNKSRGNWPGFSFWTLNVLGFAVWWLVCIGLFHFVWQK